MTLPCKRKGESYLQRNSHGTISSKETLQARRGWNEVFQVMKGKDLHPRLLSPAKLSFRMEEEIKCFPDGQIKCLSINDHYRQYKKNNCIVNITDITQDDQDFSSYPCLPHHIPKTHSGKNQKFHHGQ